MNDLNDLANQKLQNKVNDGNIFNSPDGGLQAKQSQFNSTQLSKSGSNQGRRKKSQAKPSLGNKSLRLTNL